MGYTSYERVKMALEHREPDMVPFDLGGAMVTGINVNSLRRLRIHLGLSNNTSLWDKVTQLGRMDKDIIDKMGIDVVNISPNSPAKKGLVKELGIQDGHLKIIDEFGIGWKMPIKGGHFYDLYLHPLRDAKTIKDIENYPWPDPLDSARYAGLKEKAEQIIYKDKKAYIMGRMSAGMWETGIWMAGYEKFFTDMIMNQKLIHAIMDKLLEIKMKYWEKVLEIVGKDVLIVSTADDIGAQNSLLVSLELYKKLIWPYHKKLFSFIKGKAKSKVYIFFHCDGAIREAIPLLIEAGIDILNPVQVNCRGMETKALKKEFGKELTFWGGSCDNRIMAFGTKEQVREETKRRIDDLAPGGGFIFAPIHIIQSVVPPENIIVWWETLKKYGKYD